MTIAEMLQKRAAIWEQAKEILAAARKENRGLSGEEQTKYDRMLQEMDELKATADREAQAAQIDQQMRSSTSDPVRPTAGNSDPNPQAEADKAYRAAQVQYLRYGLNGMTDEARSIIAKRQMDAETRALSAVTGAAGGYAVASVSYGQLIDEIKSLGGIRNSRAEILTTANGASIPIPIADDTGNEGELLAEDGTTTDATDPTFATKALATYLFSSKIVRVPYALLQDAEVDIEAYLWKKLGERIQRTTNKYFTTGTGTSQPLGIVTGAGAGVTAVAGQVDSVTYGDLVDLFMSVDQAYRMNAEWMFADSTLKALMKLVDTTDKPLWTPSLTAAAPDMILGKRYIINPNMDDLGAGKKPILFGDMNLYKVRDVRNGAFVLRLSEKYAENGQVGFLMFSRHGGTLASGGNAVKYFKNPAA